MAKAEKPPLGEAYALLAQMEDTLISLRGIDSNDEPLDQDDLGASVEQLFTHTQHILLLLDQIEDQELSSTQRRSRP